uniref:Uncharacterized protein n=1 Tax=Aegilops tauschii subsp. strangulata TaxID=200361 RepID=A0A453KHV7_AEGTS
MWRASNYRRKLKYLIRRHRTRTPSKKETRGVLSFFEAKRCTVAAIYLSSILTR